MGIQKIMNNLIKILKMASAGCRVGMSVISISKTILFITQPSRIWIRYDKQCLVFTSELWLMAGIKLGEGNSVNVFDWFELR